MLCGLYLTGPISIGLFVYYMVMFIKSAHADKFNWVVLIWTFVIGLPRVLGFFLLFCDSIFSRKIYAMILASTVTLELLIFVINQFIIFTNDADYCERVYAVYYMVVEWDRTCDGAITLYEIASSCSVVFYLYAACCAFDHYHMGFKNEYLKVKEMHRMEVQYHANAGEMRIR